MKTRTGLVKIPFIRWNQAWMMYAFTELKIDFEL